MPEANGIDSYCHVMTDSAPHFHYMYLRLDRESNNFFYHYCDGTYYNLNFANTHPVLCSMTLLCCHEERSCLSCTAHPPFEDING